MTVVTGKNGGRRQALGERWDLIPYEPLRWIARIYAYGAEKYDPDNWKRCDPEGDQSPLSHGIAHAYEAREYEAGSPERCWLLAKAAWNLIAQLWHETEQGRARDEQFAKMMAEIRSGGHPLG